MSKPPPAASAYPQYEVAASDKQSFEQLDKAAVALLEDDRFGQWLVAACNIRPEHAHLLVVQEVTGSTLLASPDVAGFLSREFSSIPAGRRETIVAKVAALKANLAAAPPPAAAAAAAAGEGFKRDLEEIKQRLDKLVGPSAPAVSPRAITPPLHGAVLEAAQSPAFKPESSPTVEFIGTATPQGLIAQHITRFNISNGRDIPADATLSKSQRALLASMCDDALQAKPHDMKLMEKHFSRAQLDEIRATLKGACKDEDFLTEMEWRDRVFSLLLAPLSRKFKSNGDFVLSLLTPKKHSRKAGVSKQAAFKPDKVHAQWHAADFNERFLEWIRQCGIEVGGLFLAWLVVEMKNAKQHDKDLMKLPGEMLLYMQHQAKALTGLHTSAANKIASRLPFCVGLHMDGRGCHFTFMSTELIDGWRRWFVLRKVCWSDPNSVDAVASGIAVLIDAGERYWRSWETLISARLGCSLLAGATATAATAAADADDTVSDADLSLHDLSRLTGSLFRFVAELPSNLVPLAHKVYLRQSATRVTAVKRFRTTETRLAEHELEVLLRLPRRSAHFVRPLRSCMRPGGGLWIEMEHVPANSRCFFASTLAEMHRYMLTLLEALCSLHALGIIHGDIKQTNALFDKQLQRVRIIDFGNATSAPFHGQIGGTPGYRAPETMCGYANLASDMYSAGCILASLLFRTRWKQDVCHNFYNKSHRECSHIVGYEPALWCAEAWDLMQLLLNPAHKERPSAAACLQHAYIATQRDEKLACQKFSKRTSGDL